MVATAGRRGWRRWQVWALLTLAAVCGGVWALSRWKGVDQGFVSPLLTARMYSIGIQVGNGLLVVDWDLRPNPRAVPTLQYSDASGSVLITTTYPAGSSTLAAERRVTPDPGLMVTPKDAPEQIEYIACMLRLRCDDWPAWRPDVELHSGYGAVSLPLWIPATLFLAAAAWNWRRGRGFPPGHCARCGYDLTGNVSGRCPECGTACESRQSG